MSCSLLSLFLRTYLKLDNGLRWSLARFYGRRVARRALGCSTPGYRQIHCSSALRSEEITSDLSPHEVTQTLRKNEFSKEFSAGSVKSYDSNQLASNNPIEDMRSEAKCVMTEGFLMGVYDGHAGPSCAQVVSKRLLNYIAAALLPPKKLEQYTSQAMKGNLLQHFNDRVAIVEDLQQLYKLSFSQYLSVLKNNIDLKSVDTTDIKFGLETGITCLDKDLSSEVLDQFHKSKSVNKKTLAIALSGAVVCVSHIDGPHLHVANVGDCNAVLGTMTEDKDWIAKKITKEHNAENIEELKRIWKEHPESERRTVIRRDRLLGELAPLRSMGDYRYKWPTGTLLNVAVPVVGPNAIPQNYLTPPYLTAKPDVFYHRLTPKDKFLIIASDGLWDMLTPLQAVKLVGEHMRGKVHFNPLKLPPKNIQLGDINELLDHRKESAKSKPKDRNAATHLIRHAVGGTEYGVDHSRLAHLLSLSSDVSRMFRDDITVTIAYFDTEYLRQCPA